MHKNTLPARLLFVINPISGGIDKSNLPAEIKAYCQRLNMDFHIEETPQDGNTEKILARIDSFKPSAIVAGGGDGTVNFVGRLLLNKAIPLGILPLGSSNALAKNLNIPTGNTEAALDCVAHFHTKEIDTLLINDKPCLHICDIGFNANLIYRFDNRKYRGMGSYALCMLKELRRFRFFRYEVQSTKEHLKGKAFSITITNSKIYGTRAVINPKGKIADGKFEICIIKPFPKIMLLPLTLRLFTKTLPTSSYSIYIRAEEATLFNFDHQKIHIDGEPIKMDEKLSIRENPKSLKVIVPDS